MSEKIPTIHVSESARRAILDAAASEAESATGTEAGTAAGTAASAAPGVEADAADDAAGSRPAALLRLTIGERYACDLRFDSAEPGDLRIDAGGLTLLLDAPSAARADGVSIDFVTGHDGSGFTIDNPNAPASVRQLTAPALQRMMASGVPFVLVDVRTEEEREIAKIDGSHLFDQAGHDFVMSLDRQTTLVFQCHHGIRSQAAAEYCLREGFRNLYNLEGGIDAWSAQVDPSVPRY